jgi:NitT/TauT family transport system ATP-binding protein
MMGPAGAPTGGGRGGDGPGGPLLQVRNVNKVYANGTVALHNLSFSVQQGEFVSVVGASGCGKSTLLRIIAGLGDATGGEILVEGMTPLKARQSKGEMTYVFQEATLLPWRTVLSNVELPLELRGASWSERREAANEAIALVGLTGFEGVYPRELSGGMKMRVSLARALAVNPRLLLMDEPFGALDEITRQRLNEELLHIWADGKRTIVFITHSVFEAVFLSTRIITMSPRPGRVVDDIPIDLAAPRRAETRTSLPFMGLAARVSASLHAANAPLETDGSR